MSKKFYAIITLLMILPLIMTVPANAAPVQRVEMPRFDQITAISETDPDIGWSRFLAGDFDFYPDVIRYEHVEGAVAEGHNTQSMPGFHVCYAGINTRDYVPNDAGQPDANRTLAPLNWTGFRQALAWSGLSMAQKELAINDIYGPGVVVPSYTIIPEALGVWHNPGVVSPGGNYTKALELLLASGFYVDGGLLYQPNGVVVRDEIEVLSPVEAPTSVEFCQRFVDVWNDFFFNFVGVTNCVFVNSAIPFSTEVVRAFLWRNFDIYWLCWGLSRFPDFMYDFFHSSQDGPWYYNSPGIKDATLDAYLETVKWGLVYEEKLAACYEAQRLIAEELIPYIFFYHRVYWTITRWGPTDGLANIINMKGVGADNGWTWNLMHWVNQTGGNVNYMWGAPPDNMHPGWADSAYEVWLIGQCLEGLTATTPDLEDMAWIGVDWEMEPFDWEPLDIINGTKVTFRIRDGATWHDGWPVTAEDIKFSWEFMRNFPRFYTTYMYLMWIEIHDPNTITAYLDITSQYIIYDFAGLALYFPKHIYNPDWHPTRDPVVDRVDTISWQDWMTDYTGPIPDEVAGWTPGDPSPTGIPPKALVGSGSYYFFEYDELAETAVVKKNPNYWVYSPVCCGIDASGRIDPDTDYPFEVVICNQGAKDENGTIVPVEIDDFDIYVDGGYVETVPVALAIDPFSGMSFAVPPDILNLPAGEYEVCIKVYETGDPVNPIVECCKTIYITIKEDINLDIKVRVDDVLAAAMAFGSAPPPFSGHERWDERVDINDDFKVRVDDILAIALKFGWG